MNAVQSSCQDAVSLPVASMVLRKSHTAPHGKHIVCSRESSSKVKVRLDDTSPKAINGLQVSRVRERKLIWTDTDGISIFLMCLW